MKEVKILIGWSRVTYWHIITNRITLICLTAISRLTSIGRTDRHSWHGKKRTFILARLIHRSTNWAIRHFFKNNSSLLAMMIPFSFFEWLVGRIRRLPKLAGASRTTQAPSIFWIEKVWSHRINYFTFHTHFFLMKTIWLVIGSHWLRRFIDHKTRNFRNFHRNIN